MPNIKLVSAWIPALAGLGLLVIASRTGLLAVLLAAVPGALMLAGGVRLLLVPDLRAPQYVAIGSVLGILLALPIGLAGGGAPGAVTFVLSVAAFLAGGWFQISLQPSLDGVPAPVPALSYSAMVALDDAMLSMMAFMSPLPAADALREAVRESEAAFALFAERGYLEQPWTFHSTPPEIASVESSPLRIRGFDCEHIRFPSGYEPETLLPGRDRWLSYSQNRTSHTVILRRRKSAPWLVCVHGFGMGSSPERDFQAFRAAQLHEREGINVALFTLPVHGPRAPGGGFNGEKFFGLSVVDFLHAEAQAVWDLRRLIAWIRQQEATQVGVFGISLGAYTSAVLASIEDDLACVITGVPPTDIIAHRDFLASSLERRIMAAAGVDAKRDHAVLSVVSPLCLSPRVEHERRFMFAATGDQFVPIEQIRALWLHWEKPRISWCTGGHVSALLQREPRALVDQAVAMSFGPRAASLGAAPARALEPSAGPQP